MSVLARTAALFSMSVLTFLAWDCTLAACVVEVVEVEVEDLSRLVVSGATVDGELVDERPCDLLGVELAVSS